MAKDPLDTETSISAEVSTAGIKAAAKSRTVAAIDRLLGSFADWAAARVEGNTSKQRAKDAVEAKVISTAGNIAIGRIKGDPALANRAITQHLSGIIRAQENKEAVVAAAIEDLNRKPPSEAETHAGGDELREDFVDRLGHYAQFASTAELRERWGRVLASEIRKPGTFSQKVLRVVDEMGADVAAQFEDLCSHRIQGVVPKCIYRPLAFKEEVSLEGAGLLVDPAPGQHRVAHGVNIDAERKVWTFYFFEYAMTVAAAANLPRPSYDENINPIGALTPNGAGIPVYVLTDVGEAIASILEDKQGAAIDELAKAMAKAVAPHEVLTFKSQGDTYVPLGTYAIPAA